MVSRICVIVTARRQFSAVLLDREFAHGSLRDYLLLPFYSFSSTFLSCLRVAMVERLRWKSTGQIKDHRERTKREMLVRAEGF